MFSRASNVSSLTRPSPQIFPHSTPRTHMHTTMMHHRRLRRLDTHAPIVQLRVIDKARKNLPSPSPSPPPPTQHHQQPPSHPHAQQHESSGLGHFHAHPSRLRHWSHWMKVRSFVHRIFSLIHSHHSPSLPQDGKTTQTTTTCTHARTQTTRRHSTRRHAHALGETTTARAHTGRADEAAACTMHSNTIVILVL